MSPLHNPAGSKGWESHFFKIGLLVAVVRLGSKRKLSPEWATVSAWLGCGHTWGMQWSWQWHLVNGWGLGECWSMVTSHHTVEGYKDETKTLGSLFSTFSSLLVLGTHCCICGLFPLGVIWGPFKAPLTGPVLHHLESLQVELKVAEHLQNSELSELRMTCGSYLLSERVPICYQSWEWPTHDFVNYKDEQPYSTNYTDRAVVKTSPHRGFKGQSPSLSLLLPLGLDQDRQVSMSLERDLLLIPQLQLKYAFPPQFGTSTLCLQKYICKSFVCRTH